MVGRTKFPILDEAFLPKLIEQCRDDVERGLIYILYYSGMHGSVLKTLTESNLVRHGDKLYVEWTRTKTSLTMSAQVPKAKEPQIRAYLKSRKPSLRYTNDILKEIAGGAGFEGVSTMTFRHTKCVRLVKVEQRSLPEVCQEMGCTLGVATRNYSKLRQDQLASQYDVDSEYSS